MNKYIVEQDGDKWFAHYDDFINLQESEARFGKTPWDALRNFILRGSQLDDSEEL